MPTVMQISVELVETVFYGKNVLIDEEGSDTVDFCGLDEVDVRDLEMKPKKT